MSGLLAAAATLAWHGLIFGLVLAATWLLGICTPRKPKD